VPQGPGNGQQRLIAAVYLRRGIGTALAACRVVNRLRPSKEKSMTARRTLYEIVLGAALIGAMALAAAPIFS